MPLMIESDYNPRDESRNRTSRSSVIAGNGSKVVRTYPERRRGAERDPRDAPVCEICATPMYGLHCKIVCPNCGYKRDCSDP